METEFNGQANPDELDPGEIANQASGNPDAMRLEALDNQELKKRIKHEDHNVSRKYRLFSNHSSYGDSPHTNTSF